MSRDCVNEVKAEREPEIPSLLCRNSELAEQNRNLAVEVEQRLCAVLRGVLPEAKNPKGNAPPAMTPMGERLEELRSVQLDSMRVLQSILARLEL